MITKLGKALVLENVVSKSFMVRHNGARASQVALVVKNLSANASRHKRCHFNPWVRKIPWRRAWQPTAVFMPGESHGQRGLAGYIQYTGLQRVAHDEVT